MNRSSIGFTFSEPSQVYGWLEYAGHLKHRVYVETWRGRSFFGQAITALRSGIVVMLDKETFIHGQWKRKLLIKKRWVRVLTLPDL